FMIRVAITGLASSAGWDALQEDGWTEAQLLRWQQACEANDLFAQLPDVVAAERIAWLYSMDWLAAHRYQEWRIRYLDLLKSFGAKPSDHENALWVTAWRQWIFHPIWSYAWRAQEELAYLQFSQQDLDIVRAAARNEAWSDLETQQAAMRNNYRR